MGKEFPCVSCVILGNASDWESGLCDQKQKILIFQLVFQNVNYIRTFGFLSTFS